MHRLPKVMRACAALVLSAACSASPVRPHRADVDPIRVAAQAFVEAEFAGVDSARRNVRFSAAREAAERSRDPELGGRIVMLDSDPLVVVSRYRIGDVVADGQRARVAVEYARRARTRGDGFYERSFEEACGSETVTLNLARQGADWVVVDPPLPHVAREALRNLFAAWPPDAPAGRDAYAQKIAAAREQLDRLRCGADEARAALEEYVEAEFVGASKKDWASLVRGEGARERMRDLETDPVFVVSTYEIERVDVEGETARATVRYRRTALRARKGGEVTPSLVADDRVAIDLVREGGRWRIASLLPPRISRSALLERYEQRLEAETRDRRPSETTTRTIDGLRRLSF